MKRNLKVLKGGGGGEIVEDIPDSDCGKEGIEGGGRLLKYYWYIHLSWERVFINHLCCMPRPWF